MWRRLDVHLTRWPGMVQKHLKCDFTFSGPSPQAPAICGN
jgi:hypothetical protein